MILPSDISSALSDLLIKAIDEYKFLGKDNKIVRVTYDKENSWTVTVNGEPLNARLDSIDAVAWELENLLPEYSLNQLSKELFSWIDRIGPDIWNSDHLDEKVIDAYYRIHELAEILRDKTQVPPKVEVKMGGLEPQHIEARPGEIYINGQRICKGYFEDIDFDALAKLDKKDQIAFDGWEELD